MKIAIVTYSLEVGGVEAFIKALATCLIGHGHEVVIIETLKKGVWSDEFSKSGFFVKQLFCSITGSKKRHAKGIAAYLSNFDLVILNDSPYAQSALGLLPCSTVVIVVLHSRLTSMLSNATANAGQWDMLVAVSPKLQELVIKYCASASKVICIPNSIYVQKSWPKTNAQFSVCQQFRLVYIGAISHNPKGVFYLPEIYEKLLALSPDIQFDIVGDGGDLLELKKKFAALNVPQPFFRGIKTNSEAMAILREADALLMPSLYEGLPIVLLEAMAHGVVPVVSHLAGITDFVVTNGVDGFVAPIGDASAFADRLSSLARDRAKLQQMSKSAWMTALTRFSAEEMAGAYLNHANQLREKKLRVKVERSGKIDSSLLGDYPGIPSLMVRPLRKLMKMLGIYRKVVQPPPLYD